MTGGDHKNLELLGRIRGRWFLTILVLVLPLTLGFSFLYWRGFDHYAPPECGGPEPRDNHESALEILASGTTTRTFHATGYAYATAAVYSVLPRQPLSVLVVQILALPLVVLAVGRLGRELAGPPGECVALVGGAAYYPFGYYAAGYTSVFPAFVALAVATPLALLLHGDRRKLRLGAVVGVLLGIAVCHRPNFAIVGLFLVASLWSATGSLREGLVRSLPVGLISAGMLAGMTALNPPEPGEFLRGSQALNRGLLQGTYQYAFRWWDWEFMEGGDDAGNAAYYAHLRRIEDEAGEEYPHPAVQALLRRDAVARLVTEPWNTAKKVLVSSVRIWIFIPTHLESRAIKYAIAAQEFGLLALTVIGLVVAGRRTRAIWWLVGILLTPMLLHALVTIEPRYSLPARPVELAFAVVGLLWVVGHFRRPEASCMPEVLGRGR